MGLKPATSEDKTSCLSMICSQDLHYDFSCSIGTLEQHMKNKLCKIYLDNCPPLAIDNLDWETKA